MRLNSVPVCVYLGVSDLQNKEVRCVRLDKVPHPSLLPRVGQYALDRASTTPYGGTIRIRWMSAL